MSATKHTPMKWIPDPAVGRSIEDLRQEFEASQPKKFPWGQVGLVAALLAASGLCVYFFG